MKRSRVRLNLVFFGLLFVVVLAEATRSIITVGQITHPYQLSAVFTDANGVVAHDEVDYLGVPFGEVSHVSRDPAADGAVVHMAITKDDQIPTGSVAHLDLKSTIGEQYINFEPPPGYTGGHGPYYPADFTIPLADTTTPVQFSALLQSATTLLQAIPPQALSSLITSLATGLSGTSSSLRSLIDSGDQLSGALATNTAAINRLIANSTTLVHVVSQHRASLDSSLADLTEVAATLQAIQPTTNSLLDTASPLFQTVANLVTASEGNLDCILKGLNPLLDLTSSPTTLKELSTLLDVGPQAFGDVNDSVDFDSGPSGTGYSGAWLRVGLVVNTNNPAIAYTPVHTFPASVTVAGCTSTLRPVTGNYRPTNISQRFPVVPSRLPAPAADTLLVACVALFAAGVVGQGLTRRGLTRRGLTRRGLTGRGLTRRGLTRRGLTGRGLTGRGLTGRGLTRRGLTRRGLTRRGLTRRGLTRRRAAR